MIHQMKLKDKPFKLIQNEFKTIELRLYDEKRKLINVSDIIKFTNIETAEELKVKVIKLYKYKSFEELFSKVNKKELGYLEDEDATPQDMNQYYTKEEQEKYGVIGIKIKLINNT